VSYVASCVPSTGRVRTRCRDRGRVRRRVVAGEARRRDGRETVDDVSGGLVLARSDCPDRTGGATAMDARVCKAGCRQTVRL